MTFMSDHPSKNFAERVLERIENEHVVPRPRWEFIFKNYFFWTLGALAVVLGACAFSATFFEIVNVNWRFSVVTHANFLSFFLAAVPFLWIFVLALFILTGYINIRRTRHGYRYSLTIIALGAVLTSLTIGSGLYAAGFGAMLEKSIGDHPPFYRPILIQERSWWLAPGKGLLGGEVEQIAPDAASFSLRDFSGRLWQVDESDLSSSGLSVVAHGGTVRVVGPPAGRTGPAVSATTTFHACFVFPWEANGGRQTQINKQNAAPTQSEACKSIRPYRQLHDIDDAGL